MVNGMSVIHKQVIKLTHAQFLEKQVFSVPEDATMVEINWDTRELDGIAFWYETQAPEQGEDLSGRPVKYWSFFIRGTGHAYPSEAKHLGTVVRDGFAWHVFDADGDGVTWADL